MIIKLKINYSKYIHLLNFKYKYIRKTVKITLIIINSNKNNSF